MVSAVLWGRFERYLPLFKAGFHHQKLRVLGSLYLIIMKALCGHSSQSDTYIQVLYNKGSSEEWTQ